MIVIIVSILMIATLAFIIFKTDLVGLGVVASFVLIFTVSLLGMNPPKKEPCELETVKIVQLRQGKESSMSGGGWFLGWTINSREEFQYVIMHNENGRMIRKFLNQKTTYIIETDESPRVEYRMEKYTWPKWRTWPTQWDRVEKWYFTDGATIFVPRGTVAAQFDKIK